MKSLSILLAVCVLSALPAVKAQDCSDWSNWDLRGTYTFWGSGWIDLSKNFDPSLPGGVQPSGLFAGVYL